VTEGKEVKEKSERVAAFFDLDGTLLPLPSLERRFFRMLRWRGEIPLSSYFLWLAEAMCLLPRGLGAIVHANKMYLSGLRAFDESGAENFDDFSANESGRPSQVPWKLGASRASQAGRQESATPPTGERRNPQCLVPYFFGEAVDRVAWHAEQGHVIVLVSGTLEPLAKIAAQALEAELAARGIATKILVRATRLEEARGRFTGRVLGEGMLGAAKARAAKRLAEEMQIDLKNSFAYGDSANDQWLLDAVGNPAAVNPSGRLSCIANRRNWPELRWSQERSETQRHRGLRETMDWMTERQASDSLAPEQARAFQKLFRNAESRT
jgi:HAD superfamily hydrolase (TIGR01490 family)